MAIECSLGRIDGAVIRRSLSGYTFVELAVPMDTYNDSPKFTLTLDNRKVEYKIVGSEVYTQPGEKTIVKVSGIRSDMERWLEVCPLSIDSAEAGEILNGMNIKDGPNIPVTLLNLFQTKGQLAITLANMSAKTAFVDFEKGAVRYYSELYKQKAIRITNPFRRIYSRVPMAGYVGWDNLVSGSFPDDAQVILPFGHYNNVDENAMGNLANNCNEVAKLFSDMQIFHWSQPLALGTPVLSPLTMDKKVVVAVEEQYDDMDNLVAMYYCV